MKKPFGWLSVSLVPLALLSSAAAEANDFAKNKPLKAIEAYTFVLPAIDCYRHTKLSITTDTKALEKLLKAATAALSESQLGAMKGAAVQGAKQHDDLVAKRGKQAYCETVLGRYGPKGKIFRGLVIAKRS